MAWPGFAATAGACKGVPGASLLSHVERRASGSRGDPVWDVAWAHAVLCRARWEHGAHGTDDAANHADVCAARRECEKGAGAHAPRVLAASRHGRAPRAQEWPDVVPPAQAHSARWWLAWILRRLDERFPGDPTWDPIRASAILCRGGEAHGRHFAPRTTDEVRHRTLVEAAALLRDPAPDPSGVRRAISHGRLERRRRARR